MIIQLLKQLILFLYLSLLRSSKRRNLIKTLLPYHKKRDIEIPDIPAALDEVRHIPDGWRSSTQFLGFDNQGLCIRIKVKGGGCETVEADFDIPGYGHFCYKERLENGNQSVDSTKPIFGCRRLQIFCLDPMRRWKLCFRGPLEHSNAKSKQKHANILLYWQCFFDPYDHFLSPSCWKLAATLSCLSLKTLLTFSIFDTNLCFEQWGELRGRINIDDQEVSVRLKSVRERNFERVRANTYDSNFQQHFVLKESGLSFSQRAARINNEHMLSACVTLPITESHSASVLCVQQKADDFPNSLKLHQLIKACDMHYTVHEKLSRPCFLGQNPEMYFKTITINERTGFGIQLTNTDDIMSEVVEERWTEIENSADKNVDHETLSFHDSDKEIVSLDEKACGNIHLVGGKAHQLFLLRKSVEFNVPKGFCITTKAFAKHCSGNAIIDSAAKGIKKSLKDSRVTELEQKCVETAMLLKKVSVSDNLQKLMKSYLDNLFGEGEWENIKFAVRSSSLSEDSVETSSAGQLDTYLCIKGLDNIASSVRNCWASSFGYPVIEYRRQNGQEILESMGVIVQEMVDADVAGVIFTADPVNGNESNLVINAAHGLGELVVSGEVTPDTVTVQRGDAFRIITIQSGSQNVDKENKIKHVTTTNDCIRELCIQEEQIYLLCEKAVELENVFGVPQDIEWAIANGKLHILQARPITALNVETDDDLIHEFDSPVVSEKVLVTTCNIQEMMPGAVSTLTGDLFIKAANRALNYIALSRLGISTPVYALSSIFTLSGLSFANVTLCSANSINGVGGENAKSDIEIQVIGHSVEDHDLKAVKDFIGKKLSPPQKLMRFIREFITLNNQDKKLFESLKEKAEVFSIGRNTKTARDLYQCIDENLPFFFEMWRGYLFKISESTWSSAVIMAFMKGDAKNMSLDSLSDMALILSDCKNVITAQIPVAIENIAEQITKAGLKDIFLEMPIEECDSFLTNCSDDKLRSGYNQFLQHYGHRCIREADFIEKSWSQDPRSLMETVKLIVSHGSIRKQKRPKTIEEIVEGLQTKLTGFQKWMFKRFLVKNAMDGVASRELGKSYLIKVTDVFKQAYWRLADFMVRESRLPEQELLFFLTHREIGNLLESRSATLVRLAKRRKRIYPEKSKIVFPQVNIGLPQPVRTEKHEFQRQPFFILHGMPVCRGKAEGRACVIKSLKDAAQIVDGDVMICKFTDVGWSPYFPLISGLVTESGGLLSHGAVVARECGIPCIVSVPSATDLICTGDHVVLDGSAGTISKVQ